MFTILAFLLIAHVAYVPSEAASLFPPLESGEKILPLPYDEALPEIQDIITQELGIQDLKITLILLISHQNLESGATIIRARFLGSDGLPYMLKWLHASHHGSPVLTTYVDGTGHELNGGSGLRSSPLHLP